jgi:hypothetical protein
MKVKTSEAKDQVLNYLLAKCEGKTKLYQIRRGDSRVIDTDHPEYFEQYKRQHDEYSTDWALGGPIIERENGLMLPRGPTNPTKICGGSANSTTALTA